MTRSTKQELIVSYRIDAAQMRWYTKWYIAIPLDAELKPRFPYSAELNQHDMPAPVAGQLEQLAATSLDIRRSQQIEWRMHSRNFLRLGAAGGVGMLSGRSGSNDMQWMRYWPMSDAPKTIREAVNYGYVVLLPPSYPRPTSDRIVSIGLTALFTPVTAVLDAVVFVPFVPAWAIIWNNPDAYDAFVRFDEWMTTKTPIGWLYDD